MLTVDDYRCTLLALAQAEIQNDGFDGGIDLRPERRRLDRRRAGPGAGCASARPGREIDLTVGRSARGDLPDRALATSGGQRSRSPNRLVRPPSIDRVAQQERRARARLRAGRWQRLRHGPALHVLDGDEGPSRRRRSSPARAWAVRARRLVRPAGCSAQQPRSSRPVSGRRWRSRRAVADIGREGGPEVAASRTGGRRTVADPAARRLCLWCAAVRAMPHGHATMVAARALARKGRFHEGQRHPVRREPYRSLVDEDVPSPPPVASVPTSGVVNTARPSTPVTSSLEIGREARDLEREERAAPPPAASPAGR